jgi:hypothetical protein
MTLVSAQDNDDNQTGHARRMELARLRAGELDEATRARLLAHAEACGACRAKLSALEDEDRVFGNEISFERFAGGVTRAARERAAQPVTPLRKPRAATWLTAAAAGLAVAAALALVLRPAKPGDDSVLGTHDGNRIKGGPMEASLRIGARDGRAQRALSPDGQARLSSGDLLRLGYRTNKPRHLIALSLDDHGVVSPLYPERGDSLPVDGSSEVTYLPDAIALEGAGRERVYVLLADRPFTVEQASAAVRAAHTRAGRDLAAMAEPALPVPGASFTWLLEKP